MNDPLGISKLVAALGREVASARAGSEEGQFPILDLLGNLRDAAGSLPAAADLRGCSERAWQRLVEIVESGRSFQTGEIQWLHSLLAEIQGLGADLAGPPKTETIPTPQPSSSLIPLSVVPLSARAEEERPVELNVESDGELLREFINESREHLDNIEQGVLVLESHPGDAETLNTIFRAFHTFKGSAGFLNLVPINRLAHALESVLDLARQGQLKIVPAIIDLILRGRDLLKQFVDEMHGQLSGSRPVAPIWISVAALKAEVLVIVGRKGVGEGAPPAPEPVSAPKAPGPVLSSSSEVVETASTASKMSGSAPLSQPAAAASHSDQGGTVKVDTVKLDSMLDLVGEMVIAQSLVAQDLGNFAGQSRQFTRNLAHLSRTTRELQRISMSLRMVPIRGAFHKMTRVVRDLSAKQQKPVQLITHGEETELDRGVVEELNDPLLHMIRNSIDHGIEAPGARAARGKPAVGTIELRAFHQGGTIVLEVEDDGAGLDHNRILAKAIERGLTTPEAQLSKEEVLNFIFAPGFSTAEKVTDVSGRGVGLDVVRRNLERLRGCVAITSVPGQGTTFRIELPLTLAIIDGLIVKVGEERYIIPALSVRESFRPRAEMLSRVQGRAEVINVRGRLLPLLRLYECFGLTPVSTDPTHGIVVVVQSGSDCRALLVDTLLSKQEVVIKSLNEVMIHKNHALAGAAILGDGRVGLILDVSSLVRAESRSFAQAS